MTVTKTESTDDKLLAEAMALCSDAKIKPNESDAIGEPTEAALVNFANKNGLPKYKLEEQKPCLLYTSVSASVILVCLKYKNTSDVIQKIFLFADTMF